MNAVGRLGSYISRGVYTVSGPFHPFGGAVDIIVVEQEDGSFKSSPWYVRFGKFQGVLKTKEKVVQICVNGVEANFHMYLDHKGEAYFLREAEDVEEGESVSNLSSSSGDETEGQSPDNQKPLKSKSCNFDADSSKQVDQIEKSNGKIMTRTNSRRSKILGLVFGRRSMKENGYGEGSDIRRVDSLERAEFAANLLEVKWSTNLATNKPRKGNALPFLAPNVLDDQAYEEMRIDNKENNVSSSIHDNLEHSPDEETCSYNEQVFIGSGLDSSVQETDLEISSTSTSEKYVETLAVNESVVVSKCESPLNFSKCADESTMLVADHVENSDSVISEISGVGLLVPHELDVCPGKQFNEEEAFNRRDGVSPSCSLSQDGETDEVQSFIYCESSESSIVGNEALSKQTLYIANEEGGEIHVHAEMLHTTTEPLSEDTVTEQLLKDLEYAEQADPSHSRTPNNNATFDGPFTAPESYPQNMHTNPIPGLVEEVKSQSICTTSGLGDSFQQFQDEINMNVEGFTSNLQSSSVSVRDSATTAATNLPPSVGLEEDQLFFGDIDEFKINDVHGVESNFPVYIGGENCASCSPEGVDELIGSINKEDQSHSSEEDIVQENQSTDFENSTGNLRVSSSPIGIRTHKVSVEEVGWLTESLPTMRSQIKSFDEHHIHCLSHSLDSNSKSLNWTMESDDSSSFIKADGDKEQQLEPELPDISDALETGEVKHDSANPTFEISLCKHLFYKEMGSEAASQAFDAEKLDLEKFTSLGPMAVQDDRLVVRINGCYFPWDAAAPIVLGMVSFGSAKIFEPEGMIAVDKVEKTILGDPSKASLSPNGSWRLWPFSFRRSRSWKAVQPALHEVRNFNAENASEVKISMGEDKNMLGPKMVKKMVRTLRPTSEQLASLNLKEGKNTVTFTFFTPMLGKQQVDARIYLWKWNTRIVISDVDGTITRSDVLGQFMPLVGVDWSQTGVAHLFSAIKENGYQLLFLSARAISQAYHTRQFLFNLKQDGKALPDGPVVISPDGLFPSLYREVIRRAPHEFKISCLEEIKSLFPSDCNPFYAGFGNRDTDEVSYLKVGIPKGKIFIINPKGEVAVNRCVDTKSYKSLHALVNGMFPSTSSSEQEDFNSWNFWRLPPPIIDV